MIARIPPACYRSLSEVSPECPREYPRKWGVSEGVSDGVSLRAPGSAVSKKCPESVLEACCGFYSKRILRRVLRRGSEKGVFRRFSGICSLLRTLKIPGKEEERSKKRGIPCKRKKRGNPKKQGQEDWGGGGRGLENSGEEETYHESPPQKCFWIPAAVIHFPLPLLSVVPALPFPLEGTDP